MRYEYILFDLDGTLIDTNELILTSFLHTFNTHVPSKKVTREEVIPLMGKTLHDILSIYQPEADLVEEMVHTYRTYNFSKHDEMVTPFPEMLTTIKALHSQGIRMAVVTTKQRAGAEKGMNLCGLTPYIEVLISLTEVTHPKPHPEPIHKALSALKADPRKTLMVGDSSYDIEAAHNAGVDSAGVAWSLKGEAYLQSFKPTHMLSGLSDLLPLLEERS
jgi:pyrophosphatase PpaX